MSYSHHKKQEILDMLAAMRHQEDTVYRRSNFFWNTTTNHTQVDQSCRTKMAAWCYQVVNFCNFQRESVEIAMSMVDRFVEADRTVVDDRNLYQLACMASLYTTIKVHEHTSMHVRVITQLSQGAYSVSQVQAMEQRLLTAVQWRVHPPTTISFSRLLVDLVEASGLLIMKEQERSTLLQLTLLQCESAATDSLDTASVIACAALMNAWDSLSHHCRPQQQQISYDSLAACLQDALGQDYSPNSLCRVRTLLLEALVMGHAAVAAAVPCQQQHSTKRSHHRAVAANESSPRCVAATTAKAR